jgi:hypothetical protein
MGYEPKPIPMVTRAGPKRLASYVTGVIATLVAIGGFYLVKRLEATTAMAVVAAGAVAIWLARTSAKRGDAQIRWKVPGAVMGLLAGAALAESQDRGRSLQRQRPGGVENTDRALRERLSVLVHVALTRR